VIGGEVCLRVREYRKCVYSSRKEMFECLSSLTKMYHVFGHGTMVFFLDDNVLYILQYMNMVTIYHGTVPSTVVLPSDTTVPPQYFL